MRAFGKQFLDAEFTGCDELIESGLGQRFERWPIWFYTVRERVALNAFFQLGCLRGSIRRGLFRVVEGLFKRLSKGL